MRKPVVGMTTAMVSRKPVSSQWTTSAGTPKSAMTAGRATETVVSLRIIIAEMTRTASSAKTSHGVTPRLTGAVSHTAAHRPSSTRTATAEARGRVR